MGYLKPENRQLVMDNVQHWTPLCQSQMLLCQPLCPVPIFANRRSPFSCQISISIMTHIKHASPAKMAYKITSIFGYSILNILYTSLIWKKLKKFVTGTKCKMSGTNSLVTDILAGTIFGIIFRPAIWSIFHDDSFSYFSFQAVLHNWCNKSHGMCYPVCWIVHTV